MELVLFDMDGTLVDSAAGIFRCFRYAFEKMGEPPPDESTLKDCVGPPLLDSFVRFFGDRERAERGVAAYRERYARLGWREATLYPGAKECLAALSARGIAIGLATSKPQVFAEKILQNCGVAAYFSVVVGSRLDNTFDDKGEIIALALRLAGRSGAQTAMVGDRRQDIIGAKKNGVLPVGVRSPFAAAGELEEAGAEAIAENLASLPALLFRLARESAFFERN